VARAVPAAKIQSLGMWLFASRRTPAQGVIAHRTRALAVTVNASRLRSCSAPYPILEDAYHEWIDMYRGECPGRHENVCLLYGVCVRQAGMK